jgi:hypothetical protein
MNKIVTFGLGAAAVVVLLFAGALLFGSPSGGTGGAPGQTPEASVAEPTASPEPSPAAAASPPPLTQSFTSTQHGISVSYPEGWTAHPATEPWPTGTFPLNILEPNIDSLQDSGELFLTFASQPIGEPTPDDWVAEQMTSEEGCGTATEPIAVDGATGLIGVDCNVAVVTTGGRGYWIQLYTGGDDPAAYAVYDRAWFEEVLGTVQLQPEDAVD